MNNANAREACRYRAESVAYEFKKTEELQRLAREFFGKSESYREQDLFSLLKTMQQLDPKLSRLGFSGELTILYGYWNGIVPSYIR